MSTATVTTERTTDNVETDDYLASLGCQAGRLVDRCCVQCGYDRIIGQYTCGLCGGANGERTR